LRAAVPGLGVLARYRLEWLRHDLVAGLTLAAYLVPSGIGDASLAGLPPQAGLYACLFSGLVFWLFCSTRHGVVTVTSAISLLIGSSLSAMDGGDPARHAELAASTALVVAGLGLISWIVKAGVLVSFISETVLVGFKTGVALHIASTQLPKLFGFAGGHGSFWERSAHFAGHLDATNGVALAVGAGALGLLIAGKRFAPRLPTGLFVVVAGVAISSAAGLSAHGVSMIGHVPQGLPPISVPQVGLFEINELLPLAMACFLLGAVETAAIGRMFARKHGYRFDANQELLALGGANFAVALGAGFPVSAGMSQSLVNESSGAKTALSGLVAALILLVITLFFSGLVSDLPQPVLAAIILMAVAGLVKVDALKRLWRFNKGEFAVSMVALLGVLHAGLLKGVLIGAVISLVMLLRRGSRPYVTELGRVAGGNYFADLARHPEHVPESDVFVFRLSSSLLYFNTEWVSDRFFEMLGSRTRPVKLAVFFLGNVPIIDLAGAETLIEMHHALRDRGIDFRLAEVHGFVREALRKAGYEAECGPIDKHKTVDALVKDWRASA
jgi:high affinity sulfate transporter 1